LAFDFRTQSPKSKKHVGYMTQRFSFYEDLTIEENLDFIARIYGVPERKAAVEKSLERLGMVERRKQLAGELSGGWKQRLALSACLIHEPQLLLLDEPTAGVDPKARRDFWDEIQQLAGAGLTVLITTHYMDEAERCNRVAYISYGNLLASGTVDEVLKNSKLTTWEVTGGNLHELAEKIRPSPASNRSSRSARRCTSAGATRKNCARAWRPLITGDYHWKQIQSGLEDVFISLMETAKDNYS
jgi:ABC-2 type transport system ATP-binding protein